MLAGIYDSRRRSSPEELRARVRGAFGAGAENQTHVVGPLTVVCDRIGRSLDVAGAGCAFEGAIYNHPELARELGEDPGITTETLLARAYERWGEGMLEKLRGGFALLAWDADGERFLLAQDQVAINAVFVHRSGDEIVFASEVRYLLALLPRTPSPSEPALVRWLSLENLYDGLTPFDGVRRLRAGRRISVDHGHIDEGRYWAPKYEPPLEGSRLEVAAEFKDALVRAVDLRIRDVETVGITLSGGFDSSAVAAAMSLAKRDGQVFRGYSTVFPDDPAMDDTDMLDALAAGLPLENVRYRVGGGTARLSLMYLRDWGLPMSGPGWIVERPFMENAAGDGVEVMLDGQGGDELFGVAVYLIADRIRSGRLLSALDLVRHRGIPGFGTDLSWRATWHLLTFFGLRPAVPHNLYATLRRIKDPRRHAPQLLNDHARDIFAGVPDRLHWANGQGEPLWWLSMRQMVIDERESVGLGDFTRQRSQWAGIQGRPPLFDVDLISTALRMPPEHSFDPHLQRPLAREALGGVLPDAVRLSRRKSNLAPFYFQVMTGPDLGFLRELLGGDRLEIGRWVRRDFVRGLLDSLPERGTHDWYQWLNATWTCMTAECWLRSLEDGSFVERMLERDDIARIEYTELR